MNDWLNGIPTTNFKAVCVVIVTLITLAWMIVTQWTAHPISDSTLGMWLTFVGALWGVNFAQYWVKAKSLNPPGDTQNANSPVAPTANK